MPEDDYNHFGSTRNEYMYIIYILYYIYNICILTKVEFQK